MLSAALLSLGLSLLLGGGTALVSGASGIAAGLRISPAVIGLTVVAFGTSAPELVVNVTGALAGQTGLAFGNVVGSNLANLGLILGCAALVRPIEIQGQLVRREVPLLLLATAVVTILALDGPLSSRPAVLDRGDGLVLIFLFGIFMYVVVGDVVRGRRDPIIETVVSITEAAPIPRGWVKDGALTVLGIGGLTLGGALTIENGTELALSLGVPSAVIGLAVIAIGTSLPELATSMIAAFRDEADLCVGNLVGSNLFNGLFVLPVSALLLPIDIPSGGVADLIGSFFFAAILIPTFFLGRAHLGRLLGGTLALAYLAYMSYRVVGW